MTIETSVVAVEARILHAMRVAGWLKADRVGAWLPGTPGLHDVLTDLATREMLRAMETPQGTMYAATESGVALADNAVADLAAASAVGQLLGEFEIGDPLLKERITAFQRTRDATGAMAVIEFHSGRADLLRRIGAASVLWSGYPARFEAAVRAIEDGELDHVASPLIDSYHTVWHLLHRDLRIVADKLLG
ncbi:hypothetical protein IU500_09080 [Nocardia terpenica]|uniref:hypothetical protein n=1 Tax=Nocardia terpenica TaxID=455432 RepID=UPI001894A3CE|nr:hypothetical protein [Nocardia terpenica]MBF6062104.1 hypothetical protein [Nocardia terpenica]MBF6104192.1 hypothetical protein [Nocardia terpenica]MBF6109952.1 hypothetical protein [Nocardia terpenica]MBF6120258.1 hypothetical protein [Nocardia terpenica]MBF6152669.1 hypothetical protein [Nocardia terpenica]